MFVAKDKDFLWLSQCMKKPYGRSLTVYASVKQEKVYSGPKDFFFNFSSHSWEDESTSQPEFTSQPEL